MNNKLDNFKSILDHDRFSDQVDTPNTGGRFSIDDESWSIDRTPISVNTESFSDSEHTTSSVFENIHSSQFAALDVIGNNATVLAAKSEFLANADVYRQVGVYPRIVINDLVGPAGSQALAEPFSAVVALSGGCTGTLIAPDVVLSARHCGISVGEQAIFGANSNAGEFQVAVTSVELPAGFGFDLLGGGDVAIAFLESDVPENVATPMRLLAAGEELEGEVIKTIGYGFNGIGSEGHEFTSDGLRWAGENTIDTYGVPEAGFGSNIFSTDFDDGSIFSNTIPGSSPNPLALEATTAPGDSGGPLLVEVNNEYVVAGVLSGGTSPISFYGDISWWTGIGIYEQQITDAGGVFVVNQPVFDDHGDSIPFDATELQFTSLGVNSIGRETGMIGFFETPVERDVFSFVIDSTARVIVDARARSASFDPFLQLYNSNGQLIGQNNDSGNPSIANPQDSQLFLNNLPAGEYFAAVSGNSDTEGRYRIAVRHNAEPLQSDDFGNSAATANNLTLRDYPDTTFVNGEIGIGSDNDYVRFIANQTGELVVRSKALSGDLNTVLRGYNVGRQLIDANNNFNGSLDSRLGFNVQAGEVYFVRLSSVGASTGDFRISLRIRDGVSGDPARINLALDPYQQGNNASVAVDDLKNMTNHGSNIDGQLFASV